jgi:hypothetical protein
LTEALANALSTGRLEPEDTDSTPGNDGNDGNATGKPLRQRARPVRAKLKGKERKIKGGLTNAQVEEDGTETDALGSVEKQTEREDGLVRAKLKGKGREIKGGATNAQVEEDRTETDALASAEKQTEREDGSTRDATHSTMQPHAISVCHTAMPAMQSGQCSSNNIDIDIDVDIDFASCSVPNGLNDSFEMEKEWGSSGNEGTSFSRKT